jgi:hypothetical protein
MLSPTSKLRRNRADLVQRHNQISLPACVGFVLVVQCPEYIQAILVGILRFLELALRLQHFANPFVTHREIALKANVGFVLVGQAFGDRQAFLVGIQRFLELTLRHSDIAEIVEHPRLLF